MSYKSLKLTLETASVLLIFLLSFATSDPLAPPLSIFNSTSSSSPEIIDLSSCPPFHPIENGNIVIKKYLGHQTAVFVTCNKNFTLIGKSVIITECVDRAWKFAFNEILPKCERRCSSPPYLEHGEVVLEKKLEDVYSPTGTYLEETVATYTCNENFILEPSSSAFRICEKGVWTGKDAFCKPIRQTNCANPPVIDNGYLRPSFPIEYSPITVGQEVLYRCFGGYKLVGSQKIKCSADGVWSPEAPSCHKEAGKFFI